MTNFDQQEYKLGKLCKHGHEYENTGKSLRYKNKNNRLCVGCLKMYAQKTKDNFFAKTGKSYHYERTLARRAKLRELRDQIMMKGAAQ